MSELLRWPLLLLLLLLLRLEYPCCLVGEGMLQDTTVTGSSSRPEQVQQR